MEVSEADVEGILNELQQFPQPEEFEHLRGETIWVSEAARKYDMTGATLSRWARMGLIRKLGREANRVLLDEADVAYRTAVYRVRKGRQGRPTFDVDGNPYIPKDPRTLAQSGA